MKRLAMALFAGCLALGVTSAVPLAEPAGAHVPNGGGNHFSNCTQWVLNTGRPFQQGDTGGCVSVIQYWLNEIRYLRILDGQPVPREWTNLTVDAKWGPLTSAAVIVFQDTYMRYINGKADFETMYRMWDQCLDVSDAAGRPQPPCDHV
jgi:hypothetical protein